MSNNKNKITKTQIEQFELLVPLLRSTYDEVKEFSKKKPDGILNLFKVELINKIIVPLKELFASETMNQFLEIFDKDALPFNSDAVLVLSHYLAAADLFKDKHMIEVESLDFGFDTFSTKSWNMAEEDK